MHTSLVVIFLLHGKNLTLIFAQPERKTFDNSLECNICFKLFYLKKCKYNLSYKSKLCSSSLYNRRVRTRSRSTSTSHTYSDGTFEHTNSFDITVTSP